MLRLEPTCQALWNGLLDAVFPPRCAGCGTWHNGIFCPACHRLVQSIAAPLCAVCGFPFDPLAQAAEVCAECRDNRYHAAPPFRAARSLYLFDGPVRQATYRLKYHGKTALAAPLASLLHDYLQRQDAGQPHIPVATLAAVVPVPLHPWRRYRRGYNQSALLARELARRLHCGYGDVLRRTRYTSSQVGLSVKQRAANVQGAFAVRGELLRRCNAQGKPVLLIDDVFTTGATVRECTRVLQQADIADVYILTLARQLPHWKAPRPATPA
jgi:ComF family protein